jgi:hypothetical protein
LPISLRSERKEKNDKGKRKKLGRKPENIGGFQIGNFSLPVFFFGLQNTVTMIVLATRKKT